MKLRVLAVAAAAGLLSMSMAVAAEAAMTRSSAEHLMASGKSLACDFKSEEGGSESQGTIYFAGGKMRGEFKIVDPPHGTYDGHMIQDGSGWAYTWGGPMGETTGTKMRVDQASKHVSKKTRGFDVDKEVDMDCHEWKEDPSKFKTPSGIEFMDLSQMMGGALGSMSEAGLGRLPTDQNPSGYNPQDMQSIKCQVCEQAPDPESRAQCRQMLKC